MAQKQQAKYEGIAKALASRGRHGDSMMIHVSPDEVRYLEAIAPSLGVNLPGGRLPINPDTGQPEAFPFLLGLLGAIPAAVTSAVAAVPAAVTAGSLGAAGSTLGGAVTGSLTASLAPLTGMFTGGLTGISQGLLGTTLTSALGLGGGGGAGVGGVAGAAGAGGALGGESLGAALGTGEIIAEAGLTGGELAGQLGTVGAEAAEVATTALPEVAGMEIGSMLPQSVGSLGNVAGGAGNLGGGLGNVGSAATTVAESTPQLAGMPMPSQLPQMASNLVPQSAFEAAPTFMESVQSGLQAFGQDPVGSIGKAATKAGKLAIENPIETAAGIYGLDAMMPQDTDTPDDGGPGETWASSQEGGDPFLYRGVGEGGGQMTPGQDHIAESGVQSPAGGIMGTFQDTMDMGEPAIPGVVDQGIGSMPVGPDTAAPVGLGAAEIPDIAGAEEAFDLVQSEGGAADFDGIGMDEILSTLPEDLTLEELEEIKLLMAQMGPDAIRQYMGGFGNG